MSKRKEKISAFLDNAIHTDELMSFSLSGEKSDAKTIQRYQMMGDIMRQEFSSSSYLDVSEAVQAALAQENIKSSESAVTTTAKQTNIFSSWLKPAIGMAVAASVATVMVLNFSPLQSPQSLITPVAKNLPTVKTTQYSQVAKNAPTILPLVPPTEVVQQEQQQQANNFSPYINQHLEQVQPDASQARLPYVRAVSFEQ